MNYRGLILSVAGFTVACGGAVTDSAVGMEEGDADTGSNEAASDAASTDAGEFACGDAICAPSQICLYPAYGCIAFALPDGGSCPDGTEYSDATGDCLQSPPPPSCVSLAPGESFFDCSGGGTYPACSTVTTPIPSGCSRVCREICV